MIPRKLYRFITAVSFTGIREETGCLPPRRERVILYSRVLQQVRFQIFHCYYLAAYNCVTFFQFNCDRMRAIFYILIYSYQTIYDGLRIRRKLYLPLLPAVFATNFYSRCSICGYIGGQGQYLCIARCIAYSNIKWMISNLGCGNLRQT